MKEGQGAEKKLSGGVGPGQGLPAGVRAGKASRGASAKR